MWDGKFLRLTAHSFLLLLNVSQLCEKGCGTFFVVKQAVNVNLAVSFDNLMTFTRFTGAVIRFCPKGFAKARRLSHKGCPESVGV